MSLDEIVPDPGKTWFALDGDHLIDLLRRAQSGETPDMLILELYVNSDREQVRGRGTDFCVGCFEGTPPTVPKAGCDCCAVGHDWCIRGKVEDAEITDD